MKTKLRKFEDLIVELTSTPDLLVKHQKAQDEEFEEQIEKLLKRNADELEEKNKEEAEIRKLILRKLRDKSPSDIDGEVVLQGEWKLITSNSIGKLVTHNKVVFIFKRTNTNKYRIFKYLFGNPNNRINYSTITSESIYLTSKKERAYKLNERMRKTINSLRKEFVEKRVPIDIKTQEGFTLTFKNS